MKKQLNEIKRIQQLAGLITESEYQKSLMNEDLPIEGELIGDEFHVDFDDIGNLWWDEFVKKHGHEPDDLNDEDNDNFGIIQIDVVNDLESKLSQIYNKPITLKYVY